MMKDKVNEVFKDLIDNLLNYTWWDVLECSLEIPENYDPEHKLLVITGDNASGKSFFGKFLTMFVRHHSQKKIEVFDITMEFRTRSGIERCFVFGSEQEFSTGYNSVNVLISAFDNCKNRKNEHFLVLDEPDIGLSESYQYAVGDAILKFCRDLPALTRGVVVITHSKPIIETLSEINPLHIRFGDTKTMGEILTSGPEKRVAEDLEKLREKGLTTFRTLAGMMKV